MIEIKDLTMIYGGRAVLDHVNLNLENGEIVGLLGENGSGKTSLLRILSGLERNYTGLVKINGKNPGDVTNKYVSYQPDHLPVDPSFKIKKLGKLYGNFFSDFKEEKFMNLIEGFGIDKNLKIKECSKGMKEKIQIALSLSRKSQVYLLDEPMSGIDPKSRKVILQTIIDNFDYEGILLISTHLIGEIEKVLDRAIFIDQAKIIVNERVDDIREKKNMGVEEYFTEVI
ncbi:ABC transporter ATP-binding protein [Anaerococcus marasmi]|uniref:ABC transporter ATP-binding protein n=1 Tax=Anaerococcus marasmi TaxID=2057797 RepID=UPI000CF87725|nr:ABC transporter ATP-binding protein [Anaerococcus marasmi]